ncbi:hypothetical protein Droror1_Dr00002274 [Drosera rotundifolia]
MKPVPWKASAKELEANDLPVGTTSSKTNESETMLQIDRGKQNLTASAVQEKKKKGLSHQPGAGDEFMAQTAGSGSLSCQEQVPNCEIGANFIVNLMVIAWAFKQSLIHSTCRISKRSNYRRIAWSLRGKLLRLSVILDAKEMLKNGVGDQRRWVLILLWLLWF